MKTEKVEKLVANLHDRKKICYTHNKCIASTKSWISIEFNQEAWLKSYIEMCTKLRINANK